jgi:hypothetical protein
MLSGNMGARKILNVAFGLMVIIIFLYALFPRFRNDWSCESSVPLNPAQSIGLDDARARRASICSDSRHHCKFAIDADPDGTFRVSVYFFETDFFEGCISRGQDIQVLVYSRDGKFVGTEEAPYA